MGKKRFSIGERVRIRKRTPGVVFLDETRHDGQPLQRRGSVSTSDSEPMKKKICRDYEDHDDVIVIESSESESSRDDEELSTSSKNRTPDGSASSAAADDDDQEDDDDDDEAQVSSDSSSSSSESDHHDDEDFEVDEPCEEEEEEESDDEVGSDESTEPIMTSKKMKKPFVGTESNNSPKKKKNNFSVEEGEATNKAKQVLEVEEKVIVAENEKKRCGFGKKKPKKLDVFQLLVNSEWEEGEKRSSDVEDEEEMDKCEAAMKEEPHLLPQKFSFGVEEPNLPQKSDYEIEMDYLWDEMNFCQQVSQIGNTDASSSPPPFDSRRGNENDQIHPDLCAEGKHDFIIDEEIGIRCLHCSLVKLEIRDVLLPSEKYASEGWRRRNSFSQGDINAFGGFKFQEFGANSGYSSNYTEGTVWDVVPGVRENMYPHQQQGFEFIWANLAGTIKLDELKANQYSNTNSGGCIISHAPGTGKTRLSIVFLQSFLQVFESCKPVIIAPASLLLTWEEEFRKWDIEIPFHNLNNLDFSGKECAFAAEIVELSGQQTQNQSLIRMVKLLSWSKQKSILGVSYDLYKKLAGGTNESNKDNQERGEMRKILLKLPDLLVFDEGHTPRNKRSHIWQLLSKVEAKWRIILSGTPFQNNFEELYNTICLARPEFADKIPSSLKKLCRKRRTGKTRVTGGDTNGIEELKARIAHFVHVHKGSILEKNLPGLRSCVVVLNASDLQKGLLEKIQWTPNTFESEHKLSLASIHPSLFLQCDLSKKEESSIDREMLEGLKNSPHEGVKTRFLVEFIKLCDAMNEKVLVFSQYIDPLNLIANQLCSVFGWSQGKQVLVMHGKLEQQQRQRLRNSFNDPNNESRVLVASTKACCEGISLVGASRVVLVDIVWNPSVERQAISRAYRIGQKRVVYTYHLITRGTSESDKYCKQAEKHRISELVFSCTPSKEHCDDDHDHKSASVWEDQILDEMVAHDKLKGLFDKIIYRPRESNLAQCFGQ